MNVKDRPRLGRGLKALISQPVTIPVQPESPAAPQPVHAVPAARLSPSVASAKSEAAKLEAVRQVAAEQEAARPAVAERTAVAVDKVTAKTASTEQTAKVTPLIESLKSKPPAKPQATILARIPTTKPEESPKKVPETPKPSPAVKTDAAPKSPAKPAPIATAPAAAAVPFAAKPAATMVIPTKLEAAPVVQPVVAAVAKPPSEKFTPAVTTPVLASKDTSDRLADVPLTLIDANPHQPRSAMDPIALNELAASIKRSGVLQPVILRPINGSGTAETRRYQLVAGHRRTAAARLAGLTTIPALLRADSTDEQQAEWALIENIQRQDLNPIERARAYRSYVDQFHFTHAQAAERLGEDRATVSNFLRLLDLNAGVQTLIARGLLSSGHAKVLAGVTDPARQDALANRAIAEGLSVRKLEEAIAEAPAPITASTTETAVSAHARTLIAKSAHVVELEQELSRKLGTKLRIFPSKRKNTGKIIIQYFSLDEFDRIVEKFN